MGNGPTNPGVSVSEPWFLVPFGRFNAALGQKRCLEVIWPNNPDERDSFVGLDGALEAKRSLEALLGRSATQTLSLNLRICVLIWWKELWLQVLIDPLWQIQIFGLPDENNCIPLTIPNGKYKEEDNGWFEEGEVIRVSCDPGYQHQNRVATAKCINGTWSSVPVCVSKSAEHQLTRRPPGLLVHVSHSSACWQEVGRRAPSHPRSLTPSSLASRTETCLRWIQAWSTSVKTDTLWTVREARRPSSAYPETGPMSQSAVSEI